MLPILLLLSILILPPMSYAETKVITAEATYMMGDGESPSFAEARVLQQAKQMALEQAGTYVASYTKVHNYDLTALEIQTIAGGVLQVEVLEKTRTLVGDGLRLFVKIKATVTTDKMEELAQRIKGKNVAEEYKKLQEDYTRLTKEIEKWKRLAEKSKLGPERNAALDHLRERENDFASLQQKEVTFFKRLLAGQVLIKEAENEREKVDRLIELVRDHGHVVEIGQPSTHKIEDSKEYLLSIPLRLEASPQLLQAITDSAESLGGKVHSFSGAPSKAMIRHLIPIQLNQRLDLRKRKLPVASFLLREQFLSYDSRFRGKMVRISGTQVTNQYFWARVANVALFIDLVFEDGSRVSCQSPVFLNRVVPVIKGSLSDLLFEDLKSEVFMYSEFHPINFQWFQASITGLPSFLGGNTSERFIGIREGSVSFQVEFSLPGQKLNKLKGVESRFIEVPELAESKVATWKGMSPNELLDLIAKSGKKKADEVLNLRFKELEELARDACFIVLEGPQENPYE